MKLLLLLSLVSCATVLPKEKTIRTDRLEVKQSKDRHESIKYAFSKLLDDQDERLVYENKEQGVINFQFVEVCSPKSIGYLELRFLLESKVVGDTLELNFRGKDQRQMTIPVSHFQPRRQVITDEIYCTEEQVKETYDRVLTRIKEELEVQRAVASDKK